MTKPTFRVRPVLTRLAVAAVVVAAAIPLVAQVASSSPRGAGLAASGSEPNGAGSTSVSGPITHPDADHAGWSLPPRSAAAVGVRPTAIQTLGMDVSGWQGNVDWPTAKANGAYFAYIKATEGTGYQNSYFAQQYIGSYNVGLIRGAYHFALPDRSSGATQADYFVSHGGGWSGDGHTLPPALDIEYNPYGSSCYGYSAAGMVGWIRSFSNEVHARTSRYPVIYSTRDWWVNCTGNSGAFGGTSPLWIACYCGNSGSLPAGWSYYTFWQFASSGPLPGDQNVFNGSLSRLKALATG